MARTEAHKAMIRMGSNYVRLILCVLMGLVFFRVTMQYGGAEVTALILLLGSSAGLAAVFIDVMNASLVREIGTAWHDGDSEEFKRVYNSAIGLCCLLVPPTWIVTGILVGIVPLMKVDPSLVWAAQFFIITRGIDLTLTLLLTCPVRMYVVKERFVLANLIEVLRRAAQIGGAIVVFFFFGTTNPSLALTQFAVVSTVLLAMVMVGFGAAAIVPDKRLWPARGHVSLVTMKQVLLTARWNAGVVLATSIHLPAAQFVMNLVFGLPGNLVFGFAQTFSAYVLRLTIGATDGLDAVSVRISSGDETGRSTQVLVRHATRLQTLVAMMAGALVAVYAEPMMVLWLGRQENADKAIPLAGPLTAVIMLGVVSRAISEGWMRIMYGAGFVHRYAMLVMLAAVCSPILSVVLVLSLPDKPQMFGNFGANFAGPAAAYSISIFVFQLVLLPIVIARCTRTRYTSVLSPMRAPCAVVLISAPILVLCRWQLGWTNLFGVIAATTLFGSAVVCLFIAFGMSSVERRRFAGALTRVVSRSRGTEAIQGDVQAR